MNSIPRTVLPVPGPPVTTMTLPRGIPPPRMASRPLIPVFRNSRGMTVPDSAFQRHPVHSLLLIAAAPGVGTAITWGAPRVARCARGSAERESASSSPPPVVLRQWHFPCSSIVRRSQVVWGGALRLIREHVLDAAPVVALVQPA